MNRRNFLSAMAGVCLSTVRGAKAEDKLPNIVFILADDLGYGDLGCYGSKIRTPNLDAMAQEGVRFRQFYSASSVCSPARAALLTGRYPVRLGVPGVLFPWDTVGIPDSETTIPQMLRGVGYRTACVGKWHIGSLPKFMPNNRGFDEFYGIPFSNDMLPRPMLNNTTVVEEIADTDSLTQKFTQQAVQFITRQKDAPFFLYLAHTVPHIPLGASPQFKGRSPLGPYGDAVEEMDWSVGQVLQTLKDNGLDGNTLVIFTSDNGPWYQGSTGQLHGRKGESFDGGMREPMIARFPGRIPPNTVSQGLATIMDFLPTFARLTNASLPDAPLDGVDIWSLMTGEKENVDREVFLYFDSYNLQCARMGNWKLHLSRYNTLPWGPVPAGGRVNLPLTRPELYDLDADPGESYDISQSRPDIVAQIRRRVDLLMFTLPDKVRTAWRDTWNCRVEDPPAGGLPAPLNP